MEHTSTHSGLYLSSTQVPRSIISIKPTIGLSLFLFCVLLCASRFLFQILAFIWNCCPQRTPCMTIAEHQDHEKNNGFLSFNTSPQPRSHKEVNCPVTLSMSLALGLTPLSSFTPHFNVVYMYYHKQIKWFSVTINI
jgi:hypothetical protein